MYKTLMLCLLCVGLLSCDEVVSEERAAEIRIDTAIVPTDAAAVDAIDAAAAEIAPPDVEATATPGQAIGIRTGYTNPAKLISFAKTLKGIPYKYASTDPKVGFDCSGFITYVFNHFGITVPRTSVDFTNEGEHVQLWSSKPGDLILFTGTDSTQRWVGHMGIITQTGDSIVFIHSTSGKAYGVTETTLNPYYMGRFMKVIRVFK
jgi:cell wall-associated NlpC family hydrolase